MNREVKEKRRSVREVEREKKISALSKTENYCYKMRKCKKEVGKLWESLQDEKCGKLCMSCICNQKSQNGIGQVIEGLMKGKFGMSGFRTVQF